MSLAEYEYETRWSAVGARQSCSMVKQPVMQVFLDLDVGSELGFLFFYFFKVILLLVVDAAIAV